MTFPFTATDDMVVEGGGEALTIHSTLQIVAGTDPDSSLPVANAVINISDPVAANTAPAFADGATVAAQTFTIGTAVDLTLPTATGGNPPISYTLLPAIPGLTLDAATGVLTGMPTTVAGATMHTYTAADGDSTGGSGDEDSLTFSVTVNAAAAAATRPTFFQVASSTFTDYDEGGTAVGGPTTFFAEAGTETVVLTLGGADAAFFSITQAGALSFSTPPDFEMPRGMALRRRQQYQHLPGHHHRHRLPRRPDAGSGRHRARGRCGRGTSGRHRPDLRRRDHLPPGLHDRHGG